jgi:hypothetical protein
MNFMVSNGLGSKNSSDAMHEVRGQVYADIACYILSDGGVGPREIRVVPTTGALPINGKTEHSIYILCEPFGGLMSFTSQNPELTTFFGQSISTLPWIAQPSSP